LEFTRLWLIGGGGEEPSSNSNLRALHLQYNAFSRPSGRSIFLSIPPCLAKVPSHASVFKGIVEIREHHLRPARALALWRTPGARRSSLPSDRWLHTAAVIQFRMLGSAPRGFFEPRAGSRGLRGAYRVANQYFAQVGHLPARGVTPSNLTSPIYKTLWISVYWLWESTIHNEILVGLIQIRLWSITGVFVQRYVWFFNHLEAAVNL
jgi:hypothetical protein